MRTGFRGPPFGALKAVLYVIEHNTIQQNRSQYNTSVDNRVR